MLFLIIYLIGVPLFGFGCLAYVILTGDDELASSGAYLLITLIWPLWLVAMIILFVGFVLMFLKEELVS